ncbi:MAG: hypothetical protein JW981_09660 [Anaerolineae bacterium]|nr:hypothetical protein [Anaerolineae bacterium]
MVMQHSQPAHGGDGVQQGRQTFASRGRRNDIEALEAAIMAEAEDEARQILDEAHLKAKAIYQQAQAKAHEEREALLSQAHEEAAALRSGTLATTQLEAQTLKLRRRERILDQVFNEVSKKLMTMLQSPSYQQSAYGLLQEAIEHLNIQEVALVILADEQTRTLLGVDKLKELEAQYGVNLQFGEPLAQSTGVIVQTTDAHRRYDNTLEARLARKHDVLRASVYRILMGESL